MIEGKSVYLVSRNISYPAGWKFEGIGLRVARLTTNSFKPGNRFLQRLGKTITRNIIEVTPGELTALLERKEIVPGKVRNCERGFVAISYKTVVVGCGFWSGDSLRSQISKGLAKIFPLEQLI